MYVYFAYRNMPEYFTANTALGGTPVNSDQRFTEVKDGIYLLTFDGENYAVSTESAKKFIDDVLSKCGEKHRGFFPLEPSYNGSEIAAVVEVQGERPSDHSYYDMDAEVLLKMLEDLRSVSGEPLSRQELINYCNPNPEPDEDFELNSITHQFYPGPDNTPAAVIGNVYPDKRTSSFRIEGGETFVEIREGDSTLKYRVPSDLIPDINEKAKELCKDPAEAYVEEGEWESFIRFGKDDERIFTDPDKTIKLLKDIASKSTFVSSEEIDWNK